MAGELVVYGDFFGRFKTAQDLPLGSTAIFPTDLKHKVQVYQGKITNSTFEHEFKPEKHRILKSFVLSGVSNIEIVGNAKAPFADSRVYDFTQLIIIDPKESNKNIEYSVVLINLLLEKNVRRNDILIAIGGGITQDLVAFISTILFRGLKWVFIPTTLLAQCDSCIGSKSSINFNNLKNLLGTFYPPQEIFICPEFLLTLPITEIKSGIGEMYHYFITKDLNLVHELNNNYKNYLQKHQ